MDPIDASGSRLTFSGLASGLDTGAIVQALIDFERRPLTLLEARKSDLETQQSLLQDLNTRLLALRDAAREIDNRTPGLGAASSNEEFLAYLASSSDEAVLEADAGDAALPGSYSVRVDALAVGARQVSAGFTTADDVVATQARTLSIQYAGGSIDLTVAAGTTLSQLRDQIELDPNNDGSVRAELLFDGAGYRMLVSGLETGAANDVTVTTDLQAPGGGAFFDAALGQQAADAQLSYLGISVTRASNDVVDLIPGVTLRLRGVNDPANPADRTRVDVARDDETVVERLRTLVDAYNAVRDFSIEQSTVNPTNQRGGPLIGDSLVRGVESSLQRTLGDLYAFTGNALSNLGQIGLRFDADGRLELDEGVLQGALDGDPLAVRELLSGDGTTDGIATALARALEPLVRAGDGTLALRDDALSDRIDTLQDQIERFEDRLAKREEALVRRFSQLETLISSLQSQASFLGNLTQSLGSGNE